MRIAERGMRLADLGLGMWDGMEFGMVIELRLGVTPAD
jgi:hypothetical protein